MDLTNITVLVAGAGVSGIAAAALLERHGIDCILYDGNETLKEEEVRARFDHGCEARIVLGAFDETLVRKVGLAVLSPGIPADAPFAETLRSAGVPIWGEIELACYFEKGSVAAITGTNGKTTTTALTGAIMRRCFDDVFVVGNIGIPYTSVADKTTEQSVTVAEISSFQLETIADFHPHVSAVLNVTPDHLNRHYTMENYANTKFSITKNQTADDVCVLNYDNEPTRAFGEQLKGTRTLYFSRLTKLDEGVCLADDGDTIVYKENGRTEEICRFSKTKLLGAHNLENVMAAAAMALCMEVPAEKIREAVYAFQAVEHRIEFVKEVRGVSYYNDSKGTNTDAAIKGIEAMVRPTVLIGGGYDKKATYDEWIEACLGKMKCLILIGQTAQNIAACARAHGFEHILMCEDLREAVVTASQEAQNGDAVLLSPACASWGMFQNYEERGRLFKEYVHELEE